jgi:hypothetical protein
MDLEKLLDDIDIDHIISDFAWRNVRKKLGNIYELFDMLATLSDHLSIIENLYFYKCIHYNCCDDYIGAPEYYSCPRALHLSQIQNSCDHILFNSNCICRSLVTSIVLEPVQLIKWLLGSPNTHLMTNQLTNARGKRSRESRNPSPCKTNIQTRGRVGKLKYNFYCDWEI